MTERDHGEMSPSRPRPRLMARLAASAALLRGDLTLAVLDMILIVVSFGAVLVLRFNGQVPPGYWQRFERFALLALLVQMGSNWAWGLYGQIWRHASVQEARRILLAGLTGVCITAGVDLLLEPRRMPLSVLVLGSTVTVM